MWTRLIRSHCWQVHSLTARPTSSSAQLFFRFNGTLANDDIRGRLTAQLKIAMKAKDALTSTTIRSVLSDVYSLDKMSPEKVSHSGIVSIIRKAVARRKESAAQFISAARPDLAEGETREAAVLSRFLPPLKEQADIDTIMNNIIVTQNLKEANHKKATGELMKAFYAQVDKSLVDGQLVKQRVEAILSSSPS